VTGSRLEKGHGIDWNERRTFYFDGRPFSGFKGDTIASALLANGVRIVGRGFKYHRPRGFWGSWTEEPNGIVTVTLNGVTLPNLLATNTDIEQGMEVKSVNAFPSAAFDIKAGLDALHRFLGAGFYYKTFMWPDWHLFEPAIRKMAGLGAVTSDVIENYVSDQVHDQCELLVIGGGPCGLIAARTAAEAGHDVVLVDDHATLGGSGYQSVSIEGIESGEWIAAQRLALNNAGVRVLTHTTAFGIYDHQMIALIEQRGFAKAPRLHRFRAQRVVLATGALDRPLTFVNNDRAGIFSLSAGMDYLSRFGVRVGDRIGIASIKAFESEKRQLEAAGAEVIDIDAHDLNLKALGRRKLSGVKTSNQSIELDTLLVCGGVTPTVHLWSHATGKLQWDSSIEAFVPDAERGPGYLSVVGAANGFYDWEHAFSDARAAALTKPRTPIDRKERLKVPVPKQDQRDRQWIDVQHDVTVKDIDVAVQENYTSVEHLKRYTTLGMAIDQGKSSNMTGLSVLAQLRNTSIEQVGTTTYRPPFVPVPLTLYGGQHGGRHHHAPKRLVLEGSHRALDAALCEYGGWLRPGWYGNQARDTHIHDEVLMARDSVGLLDASPLGKIEVMGPDARAFLNFMYYNRIDSLKQGHIRYGFMLTESGAIYDDGVVSCLDEHRFVVSCSSSHVPGVEKSLEAWRQDGNDPDRIFVHNATSQWSTLTITGPKARGLLATLALPIDIAKDAFSHMSFRETLYKDQPMRVARVSFSGELSYELSVPNSIAPGLWQVLLSAAKSVHGGPIGLEAMSVMRAEKGYVIIGKDTDGETIRKPLTLRIVANGWGSALKRVGR